MTLIQGYKYILTRIDTDSSLDFAYLVVGKNAKSTIKELERKIVYQCGPLSHISSDLGTHVTDYNAQRWAERYLPQGNSIVENQNGQLKYRFFKIRGYKCIKGWVKCVLTINKNGAKGMSPLDIRVFSSGSGEKEVEEDV